ncbi:MAG: DUF4405 domain-containing protein [Firmicutes bacterium]|nr:DUF4405 domain-containing protein [Bacillota bacterium]
MNLRKLTSLTALLSFSVLAISGIVLFLTPQGRVAYWSEWKLWGLTKESWAATHILLSVLFLVMAIIHTVLNWKSIVRYLRDRSRQVSFTTPDLLVAAGLTLAFTLGPLFGLPPFRWVMDLNTFTKDQASRSYGEPPYGHAELSTLEAFAQRTQLDLPKAMDLLTQAGMAPTGPQERLVDVAKRYKRTPQQVYLVMKPAEKPKTFDGGLPEEVAPGLGRKTLRDLCTEYRLDLAMVKSRLEARHMKVSEDQPFRALAEANGTGPHELYALIRNDLKP